MMYNQFLFQYLCHLFEFIYLFNALSNKMPRLGDLKWMQWQLLTRTSVSLFVYNRDGEEWRRVRQTIAPKIMRPKIVEENIGNFNAVSKDAVARFVKLKETCEQDDHIPDLEKELNRWSMEGKLIIAVWV